jgi:nitrile hydratase accessory protein
VSDLVSPEVGQMSGISALPRENGELTFEAPWQGRAFGIAVGVVDRLGLAWEDFRQRLIVAIAEDPDRPYYDSWTAALEALLVDQGVLTVHAVDERAGSIEP